MTSKQIKEFSKRMKKRTLDIKKMLAERPRTESAKILPIGMLRRNQHD